MTSNKSDKLEQLAAAIARYEAGDTEHAQRLFDLEEEKLLAKVRNRALGLLDHRARSVAEMRTRLLDAEFPPPLVDTTIADLQRSGLLNDEVFAAEWVRQRHAMRGKSRLVLDKELREKGIAPAIRAQALEAIDEDDERRVAVILAEKKARSIKQPPADYQEKQKHLRRILGVLARRGFPQSMAMAVAREALEARIADLEQL